VEVEARDRREKPITTCVAFSPLLSHESAIEDVIMVMTSSARGEPAA
jgi:hypothetical protein